MGHQEKSRNRDRRFELTFTPYPHAFVRVIRPLLSSCASAIAGLFIEEYYGQRDMRNGQPITMLYSYIIENTGFSDRTSIGKALQELATYKIIEITSGYERRVANKYLLNIDTFEVVEGFTVETKRDYKRARELYQHWINTGEILDSLETRPSENDKSGNQTTDSLETKPDKSGNQTTDSLETRLSYINNKDLNKTTTEEDHTNSLDQIAKDCEVVVPSESARIQKAIRDKWEVTLLPSDTDIANLLRKQPVEFVLQTIERMPIQLSGGYNCRRIINTIAKWCEHPEWGAETKTASPEYYRKLEPAIETNENVAPKMSKADIDKLWLDITKGGANGKHEIGQGSPE